MSYKTTLPLESIRLAQYVDGVSCYICEGGNNPDAELCRHCYAPLALAHQFHASKQKPSLIACLGSSGAGKTVFLGMLLDMLSRYNERLHLLARGAFSISLQQNTMSALARCEFPEKTPNEPDRWNWVHCQVKGVKRKQPAELVMPDLAGEALGEELAHPGAYGTIRSYLKKCSGIMLMVDTARLEEGTHEQDFFAMKALSYLLAFDDHPKRGWPNRPLGIVFTKADQCEQIFDNPDHYAERHTPGLYQLCREKFRRARFFAASVAGGSGFRYESVGRVQVPLRVEPRGVVEPFQWLVSQVCF